MTASQGQALENAILANPDDLGAHAAYADWLIEQGDPCGEFIQVQLALEDPKRSAAERKPLREREQALLKSHARSWLGGLGRFLIGPWSGADKPFDYQFSRGWVDLVRVLVGVYEQQEEHSDAIMLAALGRSPEVRHLRRLEVVYDTRYHPFDFEEFVNGPNQAVTDAEREQVPPALLAGLVESPYLTQLRVLKLGFSDTANPLAHSTMVQPFEDCTAQQMLALLNKNPRLEELYLNTDLPGMEALFAAAQLGNLRVFQHYFGNGALQTLAANTSLGQLQQLRLHPGRDETVGLDQLDAILGSPHLAGLTHLQIHMTAYGNEGCGRIVQSGILGRLKFLDIGYGNMTDEGAVMLARCADLKHLDVIDVSRNCLTEQGIAVLKAVGIQVIAADQHDADDDAYLYEVDLE